MTRIKLSQNIDDLSSFIHQAVINPHSDLASLYEVCDSCSHFNFSGLTINLGRLSYARKRIGINKRTKLICLIAFPFGDMPNKFKKSQAEWAAEMGADELEVVPNFLSLHENKLEVFSEEIAEISSIGLPTRVIIDINNIGKEKMSLAIEACIDAGARGIQTGNGFGPVITKDKIIELKSLIKGRCSIKAVGGIKTVSQSIDLIESGSTELGTLMGPQIIQEFRELKID